jgi:SAM-dependent methyltransferase
VEQAEFWDPRLVEVYDVECTWGPDDDAFLAVATEGPGSRVLDLGCGTGRLTIALAASGLDVTGVDPAGPSLAAARRKLGAEAVTWIEGTSADLPSVAFDIALMTSHVAQFFVGDDEWAAVLADLARTVVPGGRLAFDSRPPESRAWERWNPVDSARRFTVPGGTTVEVHTEVTDVRGDVVAFTHTYRFAEDDVLTSEACLRFRPMAELEATLAGVGFAITRVDPWVDDQLIVATRG